MKKLILIIAALLVMVSCGRNNDRRFITIEKTGYTTYIVYDKETNVEYVKGSYGRMCVLVDKDGKPLIYQEK